MKIFETKFNSDDFSKNDEILGFSDPVAFGQDFGQNREKAGIGENVPQRARFQLRGHHIQDLRYS